MKPFIDYVPPKGAANLQAHRSAISFPNPGHERAIRDLFVALEMYVNASHLEYGDAVDGVLSASLGDIVDGLRGLLNGDLGRFDGGTLDQFLMDISWDIGYCADHGRMFWDCSNDRSQSCDQADRWLAERRDG